MENNWKWLSLWIIGLASCGDIIEEDISGKELMLLAPGDSTVLSTDTVTFWWEYLEGARDYQFRVVSPSFGKPQRVLADSITSANLISLRLPPGAYEWEVRALNAGFSTAYFYRSFQVDSVATAVDISDQVIELLAPGPDYVSSSLEVSFWWENLSDAEAYELFVVTPDFDAIQSIVLDTTTTNDLINLKLDSGQYQWGVRGVAGSTKTSFSVRSLIVDPE